jgi:hypothetical protein
MVCLIVRLEQTEGVIDGANISLDIAKECLIKIIYFLFSNNIFGEITFKAG